VVGKVEFVEPWGEELPDADFTKALESTPIGEENDPETCEIVFPTGGTLEKL